MQPAGYRANFPAGLSGEKGLFYDYILASNGIFMRSESPLLRATIRIANAEVRGLAPLEEKVELAHGKIPSWMGRLALNTLASVRDREMYLAITFQNGYRLRFPAQERHTASVTFDRVPNTVIDIHSHGLMGAFFSETDNTDEQGMGIYVVVGKLNEAVPEALLRVGVYGYFKELVWEDIFEL
ncbi:MAG: Mov34/MPN/PAD-1 family protein [Dehalococcoidia bacterium]